MKTLEERIHTCETENLNLRKQIRIQNIFWIFGLLVAFGGGAVASGGLKQEVFESIKAKELIVVDSSGVVRARLAGDLPDGILANGHIAKRGSQASGLMLYDEQGIERGGYVTQEQGSNVMLTLDSKYRQSALFVAGPEEESQASALRLWNKAGSIELRSDSSGQRLSIADTKMVKLQQPEVTPSVGLCAEYKMTKPVEMGQRYCQGRFTEKACNACLKD